MVEMKKYKLGDIADFDKKTLSKKDSMDVIEYLDTGSLTENIFGPMQVLSRQDAPSRAQRRVFDKTILYSTVRPRLKHYGFMEKPKENVIVSTGFVTIDVKDKFKNVIDPYYLYLLLIQDEITEYLGTIADTAVSSYPSLNPSDIQMLEFEFPDLSIQKKIASVPYNIDKRIENLRAQNRVLEQTAKTIYDYTFLQCAGHQTTYNKTLNRNIPAGWELKSLSQIESNIITGKTPSTECEDNFGGNISFITIDDIRQNTYIIKTARTLSEKGANTQSKKYLPEGSLCVSCIGTIGEVGFSVGSAQTNQQINSIVFSEDLNKYYLYFAIKEYFQYATPKQGATFGNMSKGEFEDIKLIYPDRATLEKFNMEVAPLFQKQLVNIKQIEALTIQRNTLLPLLMTGQIKV